MRRTVCRGCESRAVEPFLDLGRMPPAGGFLSSREAATREQTFPLPVHVCRDCGLVQILEVIDPEILFQDYSFSSSTIGPLVQHFTAYARWLEERLGCASVVEFGCNDGVLLAPLRDRGVRATGVDISGNITEMARGKGLDVVTGYFDEEVAGALRERLGPVDVVTGSNAFAHNDRPEIILRAARRLLAPTGHLCLEVMYAGDLLESIQWDTLYHEHLTFYGLATLQRLLERHGFRVVDVERIPMHGGSLRVVAAADATEKAKPSVAELAAWEAAKGLSDPATWHAFGRHVSRKIGVVRDTLGRLGRSTRMWAYGAAGKATMWVNACGMDYLEAVVDASPLRAGKLMPGTHTPIVFPDELRRNPPDYVFVTAWNYADLIRSKEQWFEGTWITPLPDLRFF